MSTDVPASPHARLPWVGDDEVALLTDHYELTMLEAYHAEGMAERAVFSLFVRRLPPDRNVLLACGLDTVLAYLERLRFPPGAIGHLASTGAFGAGFLEWLADLRFTGEAWAMAEGTPFFADEPILEIEAPIGEAQLVETFVMNQMHLQTVLASKALRVRLAARGRTVVDFGLRRMHGTDAGLKSARAFHVAGIDATSNVLAGRVFGVPVTGTMAHAYVQAHDDEMEAFRAFARTYPETVLLVDTYDTMAGVRKVVQLAREMGDAFQVRGIRLDSGDLAALAHEARRALDEAGLEGVAIFASGGLDERRIHELVASGAPIDGFGVGTGMGVSSDAPSLDLAYKLTAYAGEGRVKLSAEKGTLPGRKQVYRQDDESGVAVRDVIAVADETLPGRPLLRKVMEGGRTLPDALESLDRMRARAADDIERLPERVRGLGRAEPGYTVQVSERLAANRYEAAARAHGGD